NVRGAFHELLHVSHALKRILNDAFVSLRELGLAAELLNVIAVCRRARNTACGSMRLFEKTGVGKIGHNITNSRRTEPFPAASRDHARTDRLARGNEGFHDRGQDLALPVSYGLAGCHTPYIYPIG